MFKIADLYLLAPEISLGLLALVVMAVDLFVKRHVVTVATALIGLIVPLGSWVLLNVLYVVIVIPPRRRKLSSLLNRVINGVRRLVRRRRQLERRRARPARDRPPRFRGH